MHPRLALLAATTSTTVAGKHKSSNSAEFLLFIAVIFFVVYFLFLRPRQQRAKRAQTQGKQLGIGDEVMSAGGIYGKIVAIDSDVVEVEVAPGVVLSFTRRAISAQPATGPAPPRGPAPSSRPAPVDDALAAEDDWSAHDSDGPEDPVADKPSDTDPDSDH